MGRADGDGRIGRVLVLRVGRNWRCCGIGRDNRHAAPAARSTWPNSFPVLAYTAPPPLLVPVEVGEVVSVTDTASVQEAKLLGMPPPSPGLSHATPPGNGVLTETPVDGPRSRGVARAVWAHSR